MIKFTWTPLSHTAVDWDLRIEISNDDRYEFITKSTATLVMNMFTFLMDLFMFAFALQLR